MSNRTVDERVLFHAALALTEPAERQALLDRACQDDSSLRARVQGLLAAHEHHGDLLEQSAAEREVVAPRDRPSEKSGAAIGRYKLLEQIGEGGFGVVYMAEQVQPIRRRVALKIIKVGMDTKQVVARFEAERQALALMDHANIAKVFDAGATDSGRPYFVMELVRGVPIMEYCDQRNLSTEQRLSVFLQVCSAIQHAHQKGIIHRDIKPTNILVSTDGDEPVPKVIDFGIAKATQGNLTDKTLFTQFRQFIGTPVYMSPEQAQMSPVDVDTRSDVYSLGVLLYELLTGKTPFDSNELISAGFEEVCRRIREDEAPVPSKRVSSLAIEERTTLASHRGLDANTFQSRLRGDLDWIVMKAVDKDRRRRYDSASAFAADVQRYLQQEPVAAVPPRVTYKVHKFIYRNRRAVWMAAAVAASLLAGTVMATVGMLRAIGASRDLATQVLQTRTALNKAESETKRASAAESTALQTAYLADMQTAHQALALYNLGLARQILNNNRHFDADNDPRHWEWRALWLQCQGDAEQTFSIGSGSLGVRSISVSHDGKWAAAAVAYGKIKVWNILNHEQSKTLIEKAVNEPSAAVAFSPTDNRLFGTAEEEGVIRSWEIPTFVESDITLPVGTRISQIRVSPDGKLLAALGYDGIVSVWELSTGKEKKQFQSGRVGGAHSGGLAISKDSTKLALGLHEKIQVVDLGTFEDLYVIDEAGRDDVEFSPDGKWLATNGGFLDKLIHVRNVSDGKVVTQLQGHSLSVTDFAFSSDGKLLASASADQTIRLWNTETWQEVRVLRGHNSRVVSLAFAPNGKRLVSGDVRGEIGVWDSNVATRAKWPISDDVVRPGEDRPHLDATFSPDSKVLATVNRDQGVTLRSAETLEVVPTMPETGGKSRGVRFSPTENLLAVGFMNGSLALFDIDNLSEVERVFVHADAEIFPVRFSKNGERLLVIANGDKEARCAIYSIDHQRVTASWTIPSRPYSAVLSPDGETVVTRHGGASYLWSVKDNGNPTILPIKRGEDVDFSPDGQHLVMDAGHGHGLAIVDITTGTTVGSLVGLRNSCSSIQFSPDGKRVAAGAHDVESVKLWDFASRRELLTLETYGWYHRQVEWSPDGNSIMLLGGPGKLSLWRVPTMEQILAED